MIQKILDKVVAKHNKRKKLQAIAIVVLSAILVFTGYTEQASLVLSCMAVFVLFAVFIVKVENKYKSLLARIYLLLDKKEQIHTLIFLKMARTQGGHELGEFLASSVVESNTRKGLCLGLIAGKMLIENEKLGIELLEGIEEKFSEK